MARTHRSVWPRLRSLALALALVALLAVPTLTPSVAGAGGVEGFDAGVAILGGGGSSSATADVTVNIRADEGKITSITIGASSPTPIGLLLPAVQAAREAA